MKKHLLSLFVLGVALSVLAGCDLYNGINLAWSITGVTYAPGAATTRVTYSVTNLGKVDLTGVNLEVGVDIYANGTYPRSAWTPDFNVSQNQTLYGSIDVFTGPGVTPLGWATVVSVDMDKPKS